MLLRFNGMIPKTLEKRSMKATVFHESERYCC